MIDPKDRKKRANSIIRKLTSEFILMEANSNPMITVKDVVFSQSRERVTIYCSVYPEDKAEFALNFLVRKKKLLRKYIQKNSHLRSIPVIQIVIDKGEAAFLEIDRLLKGLKK